MAIMGYFLGIQGGASRTVGVLQSEDAAAGSPPVARAEAGPTNLYSVGEEEARQEVEGLLDRLCEMAETDRNAIGSAALCMAGLGREEDIENWKRITDEIGLGEKAIVTGDFWAEFAAAFDDRQGVIIVSGTGSSAFGRDAQGRIARAGGWGHLLGDEGSGYDIAFEGLKVVRYAEEGMCETSLLSGILCHHLKLRRPRDLIKWVSTARKEEIAAVAPLVFEAAKLADEAAVQIIERAAYSSAFLGANVADQLELHNVEFNIALTGGVFRHQLDFTDQVANILKEQYPKATVALSHREAVFGALDLARERVRGKKEAATAVIPTRGESATEESHGGPDSNLPLTEQPNPRGERLDVMSSQELVWAINAEDSKVAGAVSKAVPEVAAAIDLIAGGMRERGRLIYVGAGTSGRLACLDAAECPPTFDADPGQVTAIIAGGPEALTRSVEGAEDDSEAGARAIDQEDPGPRDTVVGITASGRAPFVLGALKAAKERGCRTVFICMAEPNEKAVADVCIMPKTGPEILAGSTRLKAGTATKLILNTISTGVMVQLGKTYENRMVDLQPKSEKLRRRAHRIVGEVAGVSESEAQDWLERSGGKAKLAIAMALSGLDREEAESRLAECGGFLREFIEKERQSTKP